MVQTNRRSRFFLTSHELTSRAQKKIGTLIFACAAIAIILANTTDVYVEFWNSASGLGHFSRRDFVDEFIMSIFFFAAGLELRHEFFHGHLKEKTERRLPVVCALGGIVTPITFMLIFAAITHTFPQTDSGPILQALPVPVATDTVFALALLSFVSKRVPRELRSLVLAIVVIDDVAGLGVLSIIQGNIPPTVIAVIAGFCIPTKIGSWRIRKVMLYYLTFVVNLFVLPLFALANAGVRVEGISLSELFGASLFWALIVSQCLGKLVGVYGAAWLATRKKWATLPRKCEMRHIFVASCAAGIGFTLSLYLAEAALGDEETLLTIAQIAILMGTALAAVITVGFAMRIPQRIRPKGPDGQELPITYSGSADISADISAS